MGSQLTLHGHPESRTLYVFLEKEGQHYVPFGEERVEVPAGGSRTLRVSHGVVDQEYTYIVYLVDRDDLADGNSPPKILIAV